MFINTFTARASATAIAMLIAGSVAAFDFPDIGLETLEIPDIDFGLPDVEFSPGRPEGSGGSDPIGARGGEGNNFISGQQELSQECDAAGGAYMLVNQCYDRDGNFIRM